jgi:ribokinase
VSEFAEIVVVGSMNVDMVVSSMRMPEIGETIFGQDFKTVSGGKGANQAVSCARLGAHVMMLGAVGNDQFGLQMKQDLTQYRVDTSNITTLDSPTGTATIIHTPEDNRIIVVPGANEAYTVDKLNLYEQHIAKAKILITQLEVNYSTVERALYIAKENQVTTILNPAPARTLPRSLLETVDYLTPNETEFEILCGKPCRTEDQLEKYLVEWENAYRNKILVTRGANGCSYISNNKMITVLPLRVKVEDTTGAGDCFNGALAYQLAHKSSLDEAVQFAVRASSLSVSTFGAQASMPTLEAVMATQSSR